MENQREFWEEQTNRRHPSDGIIRAFALPKIEYITSEISLSPDASILDVGCGNGYFTYYWQQLRDTIGLDFSRAMLAAHPGEKLLQGSALNLPFPDESFELVFCSNLLHHLEDPVKAVQEMRRVSSKYVVFSEPNRSNPAILALGLVKNEERFLLRFTPSFVKSVAKAAGVKVLDCQPMGFSTPNRMPRPIVNLLSKFNTPNPFAAYIVLVGEKAAP